MKKKILPICLLSVLLFGMAACQPSTKDSSSSSATQTSSSSPVTSSSSTSSESSSSSSQAEVSFSIDSDSEVEVGKSITLVFLKNGSPDVNEVTWSITSGSEFARLEGSSLIGVKAGEVTVKGTTKEGSATKTITVKESSVQYMSIAEAKKQAEGTLVTVKGKVVAVSGTSAYIADETDSIYIYNWYCDKNDTAVVNKSFTYGQTVAIKASIAKHSGAIQLSDYEKISEDEGRKIPGTYAYALEEDITPIAPITITEDTLKSLTAANSGNLYTFTATFVSKGEPDKNGQINTNWKIGDNSVVLRTDGRYDVKQTEVVAKVNSLQAGVSYKITTPLSWYNGVQFAFLGQGTTIDEVISVSITSTVNTVVKGKTITLTAGTNDEAGVTWTSSDETKATVSEAGVVTGVAAGQATITATSKTDPTKSASVTITVTDGEVAATAITITNTETSIMLNERLTLTSKVTPDNATNKEVEYSISSGSDYAEIVDGNILVGKAIGKVTVKATVKGTSVSTTKDFDVVTDIYKLSDVLDLPNGTKIKSRGVYMGRSSMVNSYGNYNNFYVADGAISYQLYRVDADLVSNLDLVAGTTVVEFEGEVANYKGDKYTTYEAEVTSIKIVTDDSVVAPTVSMLDNEHTYELTADKINEKVSISDAIVINISRDSYGSLDMDFRVGEATYNLDLDNRYDNLETEAFTNLKVNDIVSFNSWVTAGSSDLKFSTVENFTITGHFSQPATAISLTASSTTIKIGSTATLTATLTPADSTDTVSYEITSGEEFVDLNGNIVTGKAAGSATIVAKAGNLTSDPVTITVTNEQAVTNSMTYDYTTNWGTTQVGANNLFSKAGNNENVLAALNKGVDNSIINGVTSVDSAYFSDEYDGIKFGTSDKGGAVTFTTSKPVTKISVKLMAWNKKKVTVMVNDQEFAITENSDGTINSLKEKEFVFDEPTTTIIISSVANKYRFILGGMVLTYSE